jgi:hypothetical protein
MKLGLVARVVIVQKSEFSIAQVIVNTEVSEELNLRHCEYSVSRDPVQCFFYFCDQLTNIKSGIRDKPSQSEHVYPSNDFSFDHRNFLTEASTLAGVCHREFGSLYNPDIRSASIASSRNHTGISSNPSLMFLAVQRVLGSCHGLQE